LHESGFESWSRYHLSTDLKTIAHIYVSGRLPNQDTNMSKEKVQDDKILLRLPSTLTAAMDQVLREQLPESNRSEFIRRAIRFTLDNIDAYKTSDSATVPESAGVESVEKVNAVRDLYLELSKYTEQMQKEENPAPQLQMKQIAFLVKMIGTMVYRMND